MEKKIHLVTTLASFIFLFLHWLLLFSLTLDMYSLQWVPSFFFNTGASFIPYRKLWRKIQDPIKKTTLRVTSDQSKSIN